MSAEPTSYIHAWFHVWNFSLHSVQLISTNFTWRCLFPGTMPLFWFVREFSRPRFRRNNFRRSSGQTHRGNFPKINGLLNLFLRLRTTKCRRVTECPKSTRSLASLLFFRVFRNFLFGYVVWIFVLDFYSLYILQWGAYLSLRIMLRYKSTRKLRSPCWTRIFIPDWYQQSQYVSDISVLS